MNNSSIPKKNIFAILLMSVFCLMTYSNSLHNPFLMDDHALILQNREIGDISHLQLNPFSKQKKNNDGASYIYYRPITHLADYAYFLLFGKNVFGYHVLNLLLLFICAITLYHFLNKILTNHITPLLASLFFITHPINGVLINYTSTTGYLLLILFTLLGFSSYLKYIGTRNIPNLVLSILFFCLSILCHETAIFFPFYLAAVLFFLKDYNIRKLIVSLIPFFAIIAAYLFFRMFYASLKAGVVDNISNFGISFAQYIAMYFQLLLYYLKNILFLKDIVLIYSTPPINQYLEIWILLFVMSGLVIVYLILHKWKNNPKSFALAWIIIGFGPVTLACFSRPSMGMIISPHWLLISSIGYCLLIALLFESFYRKGNKHIFTFITVFLLICYVFVSRQYNLLWANEIQYCQYMLRLSPKIPLTKFWLANAYYEKGDLENARIYFKETIMGVENDWKAYSNLGVIEGLKGNKEMELQYYFKALQQKPDSMDLMNNIAALYIEKQEYTKAEEILLKILSIEPNFTEAKRNFDILKSRMKFQDNN